MVKNNCDIKCQNERSMLFQILKSSKEEEEKRKQFILRDTFDTEMKLNSKMKKEINIYIRRYYDFVFFFFFFFFF